MLRVPVRANLTRTASALVDAAGRGVADLSPTSSAAWMVRQVTAELAAAPIGATCAVRLNGALISPLIATGDVASGDPPVLVYPGDRLEVIWESCTPGQTGTVLAIYDEVAD